MKDSTLFILIILGIIIVVLIISLITIFILSRQNLIVNVPVNDGPVRDITYKNKTMNFIVINKMTKISQQDISDVISATEVHMDNFSYHWGVGATFNMVNDYPSEEDILKGSSLVYLVDDIIGAETNFNAIALHWMTLPPPDDTASVGGSQPNAFISGAPKIPIGVPVILIPYGNSKYGLASKKDSNNAINIKDNLGEAFSHEIFETLINPYAGNGGAYQVYINNNEITLWIKEVCDPTENNQQVKINNISISNFVTPDYFNPLAPKNSLLDYMGLIKEPLKPFNGNQYGITINGVNHLNYFIDRSNSNDENVNRLAQ